MLNFQNTVGANICGQPGKSDVTPACKAPQNGANIEIERKFLLAHPNSYGNSFQARKNTIEKIIAGIPGDASMHKLEQAYISFSPEIRVRMIDNSKCVLTLKASLDESLLTCTEYEMDISQDEYLALREKRDGAAIYKTRYQFMLDGNICAVDIYGGDLYGLAVAEIEFAGIQQAKDFIPPSILGSEVTSHPGYKNAYLAMHGLPKY